MTEQASARLAAALNDLAQRCLCMTYGELATRIGFDRRGPIRRLADLL
jgi:hypothetical protein